MKREERHTYILELLTKHERLEVDLLATQFNVSLETIRRDLTALSEQGMLRKVHGGAVRFQTAQENSLALRTQINRAAKESIGKYVAHLIEDGDSLFINAGTTTAVCAEQIVHTRRKLTVITNCASIAHTMWGNGEIDHQIYLLGGLYNGIDTETSGSQLINQIRQFQVDHTIVTVGALDPVNGPMEYRVEAAEIIKVMASQSHSFTVLADYSKLDKTALVKVCDLHEVDHLITDRTPSTALQEELKREHVELHVSGFMT